MTSFHTLLGFFFFFFLKQKRSMQFKRLEALLSVAALHHMEACGSAKLKVLSYKCLTWRYAMRFFHTSILPVFVILPADHRHQNTQIQRLQLEPLRDFGKLHFVVTLGNEISLTVPFWIYQNDLGLLFNILQPNWSLYGKDFFSIMGIWTKALAWINVPWTTFVKLQKCF